MQMIGSRPFGGVKYRPTYTIGQGWAGVFTTLVDAYGNYQDAEAAQDAAEAEEAAARAQEATAAAALEIERIRLQAQRELRGDEIIPGVSNTVLVAGGLGIAGLIGAAIAFG